MEAAGKRVVVIGAGIIGVSAAVFLQQQGKQVTLIDPLPPGEGASFGNAGGVAVCEILPTITVQTVLKIPRWLIDPLGPLSIRGSHFFQSLPWFLKALRNSTPKRVAKITEARAALSLRAHSDFQHVLQAANLQDILHKREALRIYETKAEYQAEQSRLKVQRDYGYENAFLTPGEVNELEPAITKQIHGATFHSGWHYISNPGRLVSSLAELVIRNGGVILRDEVKKLEIGEGKVQALQTVQGQRLELDQLVICAGAYSNLLASQLGERASLEAERGYHIMIPEPGISLSRSITCARTPAVATPMEGGLRLAGTDEFAGLYKPPNYARADALWHHFKHIFPGLAAPDARATRWMGRRPGTPDSLPVIGPSKTCRNVWYGFGHGHMGLTWGPTTGRMLSELMASQPTNTDLTAFRMDRF